MSTQPRLTAAEIQFLDGFLEGNVMDVGTRHQLRRSWGLCARHAWAHAAVELEVRQGRPMDVVVLHEDLAGRAAAALRRTRPFPWRIARGSIRARDACLVCTNVAAAARSNRAAEGDALLELRVARVNQFRRTREAVIVTRDHWMARSCPRCTGGAGLMCRPHLLQERDCTDRERIADYLRELQERLETYLHLMWRMPPRATPAQQACWVEVVGWFAGWWLPVAVAPVSPSRGSNRNLHA
jgi:hypothetical protein